MTPLLFSCYLAKVTLLSVILYAYYYVALRDKQAFGWNRFYLLAATVLSVGVPLLNIPLHMTLPGAQAPVLVHLLRIVPGAGERLSETGAVTSGSAHTLPWNMVLFVVYGFVAATLLGVIGYQLNALVRLRRDASAARLEEVTLITTDAPGTPFSFFRWIFWDRNLPMDSENGQAIFRHELAHVRHYHSLDKTALQVFCALLFPVFPLYLIRKELQLVHEYQADDEAARNKDTAAYARFLLEHALMDRSYGLSNAFHQHPLAKRIAMIQRSLFHQRQAQAWRRWLALPLFCSVTGLFAFTLERNPPSPPSGLRTLTVIIDAGHGGSDNGALANGIQEKDVTLAIAKDVERLATGFPVRVLLSRAGDSLIRVQDRVAFAATNHADLFISIHTNLDPSSDHSGIQTYLSKTNRHTDSSAVLGTLIAQHLKNVYPTEQVLRHTASPRTYVLDKNVCPAVLLECGFLSNKQDAAFMDSPANQERVALGILQSLSDYARGTDVRSLPMTHR